MTIRVYLMPRIGTGATMGDARRAKYGHLLPGWAPIYYGPEPYCIVMDDVDAATHAAVVANADVRALPADLNTAIVNGARTAIVSTLEAATIPAQWVANGMTYRTFLRRLAGIFFLTQRMHGKKFRLLQAALDDPISALPANVRQAFGDAAQELGLDTSGITGATLLRAALASIGAQFANSPVSYNGTLL